MALTVSECQQKVKEIVEKRDWQSNERDIFIHLVEELGEVARNVLRNNNYGTKKHQQSNMEEEIGDLFYMVLKLANHHNIRLDESLLKTIQKIEKKYPAKQ